MYFGYKYLSSIKLTSNLPVFTSPNPIATDTPFEKWKTYRDNTHFVEFKYPEVFQSSTLSVWPNEKYINVFSGLDESLFSLESEKTDESMKSWWLALPNNLQMSKYASYIDSKFVGLKSIEITFSKEALDWSEYKFILVNTFGRNYSILITHKDSTLVDKILSTFKFFK